MQFRLFANQQKKTKRINDAATAIKRCYNLPVNTVQSDPYLLI